MNGTGITRSKTMKADKHYQMRVLKEHLLNKAEEILKKKKNKERHKSVNLIKEQTKPSI